MPLDQPDGPRGTARTAATGPSTGGWQPAPIRGSFSGATAHRARARGSSARSRSTPCRAAARARSPRPPPRCARAARAEPSREPLSSTSTSVANGSARALARDRVQPAQQQLALGGVDHAVPQLDLGRVGPGPPGVGVRHPHIVSRLLSLPVRVHVVDPSAYTPPYDHALCRALTEAAATSTLFTSRFAYGSVAPADGYLRRERFYRTARMARGPRTRAASKLAEHIPDMLRYRRLARAADLVHFQWLTVQQLDGHLLPGRHSKAGIRPPAGAHGPRRPPASRVAGSASPRSGATGASTRSSSTPSTAVCA